VSIGWLSFQLLTALQKLGSNLEDCLHMVLPPIVKLFDSSDVPLTIRRQALYTVEKLSDSLDLTEYASK
jgi:FKBP12-rapamycin complex-associated protein